MKLAIGGAIGVAILGGGFLAFLFSSDRAPANEMLSCQETMRDDILRHENEVIFVEDSGWSKREDPILRVGGTLIVPKGGNASTVRDFLCLFEDGQIVSVELN